MLAKRVYGQITNNNDLRSLEQEALQYGGHAVGITRPGTLYKLDPAINKAVVITPEEAAKILEIDINEILKYVDKRGHYELPQIEVAPEPEPTPEPAVEIPEIVEPEADSEAEEYEYEDEDPEEEEAEADEHVEAEEPEGPRQGLARVNEKLEKMASINEASNSTLIEILLELKAIHVVLDQIDSKLLD